MLQRVLKLLGIFALTQSRNNNAVAQTEYLPISSIHDQNPTYQPEFYIDIAGNNIVENPVILDTIQSLEFKKRAEQIFSKRESDYADKALELIDRAIALNSRGEWLHYDKGRYLNKLKRSQEAIDAFTKEIDIGHDFQSISRSYYERAFSYLDSKNVTQAFADIASATEADVANLLSQNIAIFYQSYSKELIKEKRLAYLNEHQKKSGSKIAELIKTANDSSQDKVVEIGQYLTQHNALEYINERGLPFYSDTTSTKLGILGIESYKNKNYQKAVEYFTQQTDSGTTSVELIYLRALSQLALGNNAEAVLDLEETLEKGKKNNQNINWFHHYKGIALTNIGLFEEALSNFSAELEINSNPHSLIYRGLLNQHLGYEEHAQKDFEQFTSTQSKELFFIGVTTVLIALAGTMCLICLNEQNRLAIENRNQNLPHESNNSVHRTDPNEIRGAINQLVKAIFSYIEINETQQKLLANTSPQIIKKICEDLNQVNSSEEIDKIFQKKYSKEIDPELAKFFAQIYNDSIPMKTTKIVTTYPQNFVYNAAIKGDATVRSINQTKLQEYIKIFDDLITDTTISDTNQASVKLILEEMLEFVAEKNSKLKPNPTVKNITEPSPIQLSVHSISSNNTI